MSLCFFVASSRVFVPSGLSLCVFACLCGKKMRPNYSIKVDLRQGIKCVIKGQWRGSLAALASVQNILCWHFKNTNPNTYTF